MYMLPTTDEVYFRVSRADEEEFPFEDRWQLLNNLKQGMRDVLLLGWNIVMQCVSTNCSIKPNNATCMQLTKTAG